jgi:hypothetical protein
LSDSVTHVLCATEVQSGLHAYFSREFIYSFAYGISTTAGRLELARAVQACAERGFRSAALVRALAVFRLDATRERLPAAGPRGRLGNCRCITAENPETRTD